MTGGSDVQPVRRKMSPSVSGNFPEPKSKLPEKNLSVFGKFFVETAESQLKYSKLGGNSLGLSELDHEEDISMKKVRKRFNRDKFLQE
jgi:hypothetical protein